MIKAIGVVIFIVLFLIAVLIVNTRTTETALLTGFWKADASFCEEAGVELFLVYIGESAKLSHNRNGYILVKNDDGLIINNPVNFSISGGYSINPRLCHERRYSVNISWLDDEPSDFFPSKQELYYYPAHGKLVFCVNEQVYAILYKDHSISDLVKHELMPESTKLSDNMTNNEYSENDLTDLDD